MRQEEIVANFANAQLPQAVDAEIMYVLVTYDLLLLISYVYDR